MMLRRRPRRGLASFDAAMCAAALFPIAAAIYWLFEEAMGMYVLTLGTAVGWPLM